jgi:hypothetical protein
MSANPDYGIIYYAGVQRRGRGKPSSVRCRTYVEIFIGLSEFECIEFAMFGTEQSIYVGYGNTDRLGQREFAIDVGRGTTAKPAARGAARG